MIYPENFESKIGFDLIRRQCELNCSMELARQMLHEQGFSTSVAEIDRRQFLTDEMRQMLISEPEMPHDEFFDLGDSVSKLRIEGAFLPVEEVVRLGLTVRASDNFVQFVRSRKQGDYTYLKSATENQQDLSHIVREVDRIIDEKGEIRDSASAELQRVRSEIRQHEGQVAKRLQSVLQRAKSDGIVEADAVISVREGRAVIPVHAVNKRKLQGFIHDESATGRTFYIEPVEVVELNNRLRELEYEERREIVRILTAFTDLCRPDADAIAQSEEYAALIDMLRAKARWALENRAVRPVISLNVGAGVELSLLGARHPLLQQTLKRSGRELVPLDARLSSKERILVISGPNAGGKSVCLKTFGIIQYMFQCGFPVTASENSELPVFNSLFIDIGDQQSIENDLSTYSSHLLNMKQMMAHADTKTMVLIDEFGTGTEPVMGAAIAEAVLEKLLESGCFGVLTTHYTNIKYFASNNAGVINGAMMFDVQNIRPLFRLETGKPGSSFAIEIARKIGLPEQIIEAAKQKAGTEHVDMERQLREIARDRHYWQQKRDRIRQTDRHVEELEESYREQLQKIRDERQKIIHDAKQQAKELLQEANRKIESTIRTIRETQAEKEQTKLLRRELTDFGDAVESSQADSAGRQARIDQEMERLQRRLERREQRKATQGEKKSEAQPVQQKKIEPVEVGSKVRMKGSEGVGVVQSIRGKKAQIAFGQMLTTIDISRVEVISAAQYKAATRPQTPTTVFSSDISARRLAFKTSIDIRGERVVDALDRVRDLCDDALMLGVGSVTILHGKGTGALKEEVRRYLRTLPEVESAVDDHADRGGAGITVVTFKTLL